MKRKALIEKLLVVLLFAAILLCWYVFHGKKFNHPAGQISYQDF